MKVDSIPFRWPGSWTDPGLRRLLPASWVRVEEIPSGVVPVRGPWPGIRLSHAGGDRAIAGPTGEAWVDSNGWRVRVARAMHPEATLWVDARPQTSRASAEDYILALADAAAHGAQWIVTLDDRLAAGIAAQQAGDLEIWNRVARAADFFAGLDTKGYRDSAVIGVLANFGSAKAGFTHEVLNNLARTKQQYRAIDLGHVTPGAFDGLKGIIYTDAGEPSGAVRKQVMEFVDHGGILITGPAWGSVPKGTAAGTHPRFAIRKVGAGSVALASNAFSDPYQAPNDAVMLVSHRNDIVRFFNSGSITPCLSTATDNQRAVLQTVFYSLRPVEDVSVWVKGIWRTARIRTPYRPEPQNVKLEVREGGVELYLPPVAQYCRIDLES